MKVFKMPWKQQTVDLESVILVEKMSSKSRLDLEEMNIIDDNEYVNWKSKCKLVGLYEVYKDKESYEKRVIPIDIVKYTITKSWEDVTSKDISDILIENIHTNKLDNQDFSKGQVVIL